MAGCTTIPTEEFSDHFIFVGSDGDLESIEPERRLGAFAVASEIETNACLQSSARY